ncbi:MAG: UDP-N-acetylmuramate dehydrogenase [Gammaproteobacteria bacterium]
MIRLLADADLSALNTFGLPGRARWLAEVDDFDELPGLLRDPRFSGLPRLVLGGGSNVVLRGGKVDALVIRLCAAGWRIVARDGTHARIEADAGMAWHALVTACVDGGLGGIENLALIPGTVGAAPVQNIGAYGIELESVLHSLDAVDLASGEFRTYARADCALGYRDSIFKHAARGMAIVRVRLDLDAAAPLRCEYRDLRDEITARGIETPTRRDVYDMVCAIRRRKLPDPAVIGNAGSFFKNPVVSAAGYAALREHFPDLVAYAQADGSVKLAAGWLIDRAGWKGFRDGPVGVHEKQALVLVNHGGASGAQVLSLAQRIVDDVRARYGVTLAMEPVVL